MNCIKCNAKLKGRQSKFCSLKCKNINNNIVYNIYGLQKIRGLKRKLALINKFGGKCELCGYNKNISALCFHHMNPKRKLFTVDIRKLSNYNWKTILKEAKKCRLLCHNCHSEIHHPGFVLADIIHFSDVQLKIRKKKRTPKCKCGIAISKDAKRCHKCYNSNRPKRINWPDISFLLKSLKTKSKQALAKELGVSDNAINKRLKKFGFWVGRHGLEP